jgi:solute carrier family 35 protein E2
MIAVSMQIMFLAFNWFSNPRSAITGSSHHSALYLFVLLSFDGLGFYLQSIFAYLLMSMVSPVTHSVANCVKRALLITLSIFHYGNDVTLLNWTGMVLVIVGVYVFNAASRIERMESLKAILSGKNVSSCASVQIERKTISTLSEIRINR